VLLAILASSPYTYQRGETGVDSNRFITLHQGLLNFPRSVSESRPLESIAHFENVLREISGEVNKYLEQGRLDPNTQELYCSRSDGAYAPFELLEPHQIYWQTRFRTDHKNSESDFSIELRSMDLPISIERMQTINSFVVGLAYYAADKGVDALPRFPFRAGELETMSTAACGMNVNLFGYSPIDAVQKLLPYAADGLRHRGYTPDAMIQGIGQILSFGNDATDIRTNFCGEINVGYLTRRLRE